jgi:hypothetical protein
VTERTERHARGAATESLPEEQPPRLRLTDRDRALARFVARWGPVTQPQVARRVEMSRLPSFRRLHALREGGYLQYDRPVDELPGVFTSTARGVELAGSVCEVAGPPASYALWAHLAAVDAAVDAELAGVHTATRLEALTDERLRGAIPRTPGGAEVPPRALLLDPAGAIAVYAVVRPAAGPAGVIDELVAMTLESYRQLDAVTVRRRVLVSAELAAEPAVRALRDAGAEVVELDPLAVARDRD